MPVYALGGIAPENLERVFLAGADGACLMSYTMRASEKELKEVCLLEQTFVKDSDFTIKKLVAEVAKTVGSDIKVGRVVRFEVGEGIEKKEENFAEEVAKQLK